MTISVLLVGLGQIGMGYDLEADPAKHVWSHARAFTRHSGFQLVAAVDPAAERRRIFEERYGLPVFARVEDAMAQHQADVVVIATPTRAHGDVLRTVLGGARPRAILCEKPLSYELSDARWMVEACTAGEVDLFVNYMRRSDPAVIEIKRRLDAGDMSGPVKGITWYSKGFLHNGSHFFNLLQYWLGPMESAEVLHSGRMGEDADPEPDVEVVYTAGGVIFLAAQEEHFSHYTVELVTPGGRLRYDQGGARVEWHAAHADPYLHGYRVLSPEAEMIVSGMDRYQWHVADQLAKALAGESAHLCSGADALATLEAMHRIMGRL